MKNVRVIIFRGWMGEVFSTGMDTLAEKIHEKCGHECEVYAYDEHLRVMCEIKHDERVILIGHSYGALAVYNIARNLYSKSFPLVVTFDFSPYKSLIVRDVPETVPENVEHAINFFQKVDPIVRGVVLTREDGSVKKIQNIESKTYHAIIDKEEVLHDIVTTAIKLRT